MPRFTRTALSVLSFLVLATPAPAAYSGGGVNAPPECPKGQVWSGQDGKCVEAKSSLSDEELIASGRALAQAGRYDEALNVLDLVSSKSAVALTLIGYSLRKSGKVEEGIARYHEALALDPTNTDAREYLGEGYVASGRIDLAEAELQKIEALCGRECEPYQELAEAIARAR